MEFTVNEKKQLTNKDSLRISELLEWQGLSHWNGIAVAVNQQVIPQADWLDYSIKSNDQVLIITATQGG